MSDQNPNSPCQECAIAQGTALAQGIERVACGPFVVHARSDGGCLPGWIIVAPRRHVEQIDDLNLEEQQALGPLLSRVATALRQQTACEKIYVSIFAEVLHHLHVHVVARPFDAPPHLRGAAIFATSAKAATPQIVSIARGVLARLQQATPTILE